jgi:hypothetical protein
MSISANTQVHGADAVGSSSRDFLASELAAALLKRAFGTDFHIVDGATGQPLYCSPSLPDGNWGLWSAMCQEVARRVTPEFLQEEPPLVVLALPLVGSNGDRLVAVGVFVTRPVDPREDLSQAARRLELEPASAVRWASRQTPWLPEQLRRVAMLVLDQFAAGQQIHKLQAEAENLSLSVAATYEEISLLHRITQNLKISKSDEELGRVALEWMQEVLVRFCSTRSSVYWNPAPTVSQGVTRWARLGPAKICQIRSRLSVYRCGPSSG